MNSGVRVSIPNSVRKTIQNIKEITGNHSEDEIYAMLKECSMDPNETTQKLLLQDPFHEVKGKRNRKKENPIKEFTEPRWKPGMQGRGSRGGRGSYSSRHVPHDAGKSKNVVSGKENEINHDKKNKESSVVASASKIVVADNSSDIVAEKTGSVINDVVNSATVSSKMVGPQGKLLASSRNISASKVPPSSLPSGVHLSASDPILTHSQDPRLSIGTIRREVGSQRTPVDQVKETPVEIKISTGPEVESSLMQGRIQEDGNNLISESSRTTPSIHAPSSISRPSSNYNNRQQQAIGSQKVGAGKEWKPKPTNPIPVQESGTHDSLEVPAVTSEDRSVIPESKQDSAPEKERKIEESRIPDGQHVIIPNHLHVPEAEKLGFCFGSFDATFGFDSSGPTNEKIPSLSEGVTNQIEEQTSRNEDVLVVTPDDGDNNVAENLSSEGEISSSVGPTDQIESNQESSLPTSAHQYPVVHPSSNLSFGFMPPIIGSHLAPLENNDSQSRGDGSRVPSIVVQQPFDPASYYPQFYRGDGDGRISPFHSAKYNGNVAILSPQTSQEVGNSIPLSVSGPTQAPGGVTLAMTQQQPLPIFRQPAGGLHLSHYPPNYIPYGPYFSPFYIPPPSIHQFLSNGGAFPQHGNMYPPPPVTATHKYPLQQYNKPATNNNNNNTPNYYNQNPPPVTAGNSASNEDNLGGSQFKDSNVYGTGQQSEGPGVWIGGRGEIGASFYQGGGQVAYTPTQGGHGGFYHHHHHHPSQPVTTTGALVHPLLQQSQTGVDMVGPGPTSNMYQQQQQPQQHPSHPQSAQINWPNNY